MSKPAPVDSGARRDALKRAVAALQRADHATAIELAREATIAEPTHAGAFHLLGQALSDTGRPKEALGALLRALALDPARAAIHAVRGHALLDIDAAGAANAYGRAAELDPGSARFHDGLAVALAASGQHELALTAWSAAIALAPGNWAHHYGCGQSLLRLERIDDAIPYLSEAARLKPDSWRVQAQLGAALARLDRNEAALAPLQAAVRANPDAAQVQFTLGQVLARLDRMAEAVAPLEIAVRLTPDDADRRFELGSVLFRVSRRREALAHMDAAVRCRPDHEATHIQRALLLADLGRPGEALQEWCRAIECGREGLLRKVYFYPLSRMFTALSKLDGRVAAIAGAIKLTDVLARVAPPMALMSRRPETHAFLGAIAAASPHGAMDLGIIHLLRDEPVDAMACLGDHLRSGGAIDPKYDRVLADGLDAGHPAWHLMSPLFYHWATATTGMADNTQCLWQGEDVFSQARSIDELNELYAGWRRAPLVAREVLLDFLADAGRDVRRVLDFGCGFGQWLRFLRTECGVVRADLFGADFHATRVEASRILLDQVDDPQERVAAPHENLFQCNALTWNPGDFSSRHDEPDLVMLMAFISVFDNDQLSEVLARVAQLGARYLFEYSPVDRWDLNYGRLDPAEYFQRVGYRRILRQLPGEAIAGQGPDALMLPRKYWPAHQIGIYVKI